MPDHRSELEPVHGVSCVKVPHNELGGYLHREDDDSPYSVDGWMYCGRCHYVLDSVCTAREKAGEVEGG